MHKIRLKSICFFVGILLTVTAYAKSVDEETPTLVQSLAKQLVAKKRPKVAMLDFTDIQGRPNEMGRFMAEQLSVDMVKADGVVVVDRANINAIMKEHELTAEGLVKPENAKKLGQFAGVDAILIGNLAVMDNVVVLTVKAISTETAEVVAAERMKFDVTKDIQRMMGLSINNIGGDAASRSSSPVARPMEAVGAVVDEPVIATVDVGPLTAELKSVSVGVSDGIAQIRVTFDLENRNLDKIVAIAANGLVEPEIFANVPKVRAPIGSLTDSNKLRWNVSSPGLRGLTKVYCFETIAHGNMEITQNETTNVVDYIKRGTKYDGAGNLEFKTQHVWSGSFTTIEPGKKVEMTALFVPSSTGQGNQWGGNEKIKWPETVAFSLELVVGTHKDGEEPEKSKDLALRDLNISKLVLPVAQTK